MCDLQWHWKRQWTLVSMHRMWVHCEWSSQDDASNYTCDYCLMWYKSLIITKYDFISLFFDVIQILLSNYTRLLFDVVQILIPNNMWLLFDATQIIIPNCKWLLFDVISNSYS
jgi:hypothetical protein